MQLYLIRHAQSENNALWAQTKSDNGRFPDPLLTDIGHQQAAALAKFLTQTDESSPRDDLDIYNRAGFPFTHLYCSLMERAVQTGMYIAQAKQIPLLAWEMIHEWGGIFADDPESGEKRGLPGANRTYFETNYPELILPDELSDAGWWNRPFEPRDACYGRAQQFLQALHERHGNSDDQVAMVTHGGFFYSFMSALLDNWEAKAPLPHANQIWFAVNNASITRIDFNETHIRLAYLNRIEYLPTELIT